MLFRFDPYNYHHHPHQSLSPEKLVAPQHQHHFHQNPLQVSAVQSNEPPKEILSVSGKKKCSYCCEELGNVKYTFIFMIQAIAVSLII